MSASEPLGSPLRQARLRLSAVTPATAPTEAEQVARWIAKHCTTDQLATLLGETLRESDKARLELQRAEVWVYIASRARELHGYRQGEP